MSYAEVKCPVCDSKGKWKNVDQYRHKPEGMHLCESCGFITYPEVLIKKPELEEYYREDYREAPGFGNLCTGERKIHYHATFLTPLFDEWKKRGFEAPKVFEVGAAFGMFLHWMKQIFPKGEFSGAELTKSFVRNAFHLYGLKLQDKIDPAAKYDFIASYKVAEHIPEIDLELLRYRDCLNPGGKLYISVPTWFGPLTNFGANGFSIEYYYHKNHINVWSRGHFERLLAKCGFKIVQADHSIYDDTYLCEVGETAAQGEHPGPTEVEALLKQVWEAGTAFERNEFGKAMEAYANFPDAHVGHYEVNRAKFHKEGFEWIHENVIKRALKACPHSAVARAMAADISMRYSQWELGVQYGQEALKMRPNDPHILMRLADCFRQMSAHVKDPKESARLLTEARNLSMFIRQTSMSQASEAITQTMADNARLPTPWENVPVS